MRNPLPSVWAQYGAAILMGSLVLVSVLLLVASMTFLSGFLSSFSSALASVGLIGFIAILFFNLPGVRSSIAGAVSTLFLEGEVIDHFSSKARHNLSRRILATDLLKEISSLEESLAEHLETVSISVLALPHVHNYNVTVNLSDVDGHPNLISRHTTIDYVVSCRHLRDGRVSFPLRIRHELSDPRRRLEQDIVQDFELQVGNSSFGRDDLSITHEERAGTHVTLVGFDTNVDVVGEVHVKAVLQVLSDRNDPTEIVYAAYPTKGMRTYLIYKEGLCWDVAWFKFWDKTESGFPLGETQVNPRGVMTHTQEWLLPGDGVIMYWFPGDAAPQNRGENNA